MDCTSLYFNLNTLFCSSEKKICACSLFPVSCSGLCMAEDRKAGCLFIVLGVSVRCNIDVHQHLK